MWLTCLCCYNQHCISNLPQKMRRSVICNRLCSLSSRVVQTYHLHKNRWSVSFCYFTSDNTSQCQLTSASKDALAAFRMGGGCVNQIFLQTTLKLRNPFMPFSTGQTGNPNARIQACNNRSIPTTAVQKLTNVIGTFTFICKPRPGRLLANSSSE